MGKLYYGDAVIRIRNATGLNPEQHKRNEKQTILTVSTKPQDRHFSLISNDVGLFDELDVEMTIRRILTERETEANKRLPGG